MVIGSSWVQLERVSGLRWRPCLKAATRCSRETVSIRGGEWIEQYSRANGVSSIGSNVVQGSHSNIQTIGRELDVQCIKKDNYVPPHERRKSNNKGDGQTEAMLTLLLRKVNTQDSVLEELRENVVLLNQMSTSHAKLIQLLESQMNQVLNERHKDPKKGLPDEIEANHTSGT
ncbi:hypothetical protein MTR67_001752 [Solanum verrucosum]|uniref:Uncharacterized protein n=1 Tax=Solanum verrucosum TaxID=315347 RepID=A0AAF0PP58_SOLVR|nr:hypothetical protein MTR67_001752 [Solanum verrucosum]